MDFIGNIVALEVRNEKLQGTTHDKRFLQEI